jgi:hypothetical protein
MEPLDQNQQDSSKPAKPKGARGGARPNTGGARVGAGRPTGVRDTRIPQVNEIAAKYKITPLDFMMGVLNDPASSFDDKKWASQAASPYMHPRLSQVNATNENKHTVDTAEAAQLTKDIITSMFGS